MSSNEERPMRRRKKDVVWKFYTVNEHAAPKGNTITCNTCEKEYFSTTTTFCRDHLKSHTDVYANYLEELQASLKITKKADFLENKLNDQADSLLKKTYFEIHRRRLKKRRRVQRRVEELVGRGNFKHSKTDSTLQTPEHNENIINVFNKGDENENFCGVLGRFLNQIDAKIECPKNSPTSNGPSATFSLVEFLPDSSFINDEANNFASSSYSGEFKLILSTLVIGKKIAGETVTVKMDYGDSNSGFRKAIFHAEFRNHNEGLRQLKAMLENTTNFEPLIAPTESLSSLTSISIEDFNEKSEKGQPGVFPSTSVGIQTDPGHFEASSGLKISDTVNSTQRNDVLKFADGADEAVLGTRLNRVLKSSILHKDELNGMEIRTKRLQLEILKEELESKRLDNCNKRLENELKYFQIYEIKKRYNLE